MKRLWLQIGPVLQGNVSLGEFNLLWAFQAQDPASLHSLPMINALWQGFAPQGLHLLGLSTGMEAFDAEAETRSQDWLAAIAEDPVWVLPQIPIALDDLHRAEAPIPESHISFLCESIPAFASWPLHEQEALRLKARRYLASKPDWAVTLTLSELSYLPALVLFNRYYEVLEEWSIPADAEEIWARIAYWLSHVERPEPRDPFVDPF